MENRRNHLCGMAKGIEASLDADADADAECRMQNAYV